MVCEDTSLGFRASDGDNCDWYIDTPSDCGDYDTENFHAYEMCCGCGGGSVPSQCVDTTEDGATDSDGNTCDWYVNSSDYWECGDHDDEDFNAYEMCCYCNGGKMEPKPWNPASTQLKGVTKQNAEGSYTELAIAMFSAFATLAVAGWSIRTALTKRI